MCHWGAGRGQHLGHKNMPQSTASLPPSQPPSRPRRIAPRRCQPTDRTLGGRPAAHRHLKDATGSVRHLASAGAGARRHPEPPPWLPYQCANQQQQVGQSQQAHRAVRQQQDVALHIAVKKSATLLDVRMDCVLCAEEACLIAGWL